MATKGTEIDNDKQLLKFSTYEEYLDSVVTPLDLSYLRNTETTRKIAELGYRSTGETLDREFFNIRKKIIKNLLFPLWRPFTLDSELTCPKNALITELLLRERENRLNTLSTIIFIRILTKLNFEISGYIDFSHRLKRENWTCFFEGRRRLKPGKNDLMYYHWKTKKLILNETDNYQVMINKKNGLFLKNLKDFKFVYLGIYGGLEGGNFGVRVESEGYEQVVIYDHVVRSRN